uniref:FLYWCH-type domain-containing protein n=1 Tax=Anopheles maculatus TaxID=74869 RepID=A0A182SW90_9DIPT
MENKCEAGIFYHPNGTIAPSNQWNHSHSPLNPSAADCIEPVREEKVAAAVAVATTPAYTVKQLTEDDNKPDAQVATKHSIRISPDASDAFIWYKDVQYSLRHRSSDGVRIYRCRNKPCTHSLVVTKHGKIIPKKTTWHSCENQHSGEESKGKELVPWTNSASGLGFDKPEIEDPDDLDDQNASTEMQPIVKRIRLDSSNMDEMVVVPDNIGQPESDVVLQTADRLPNLDTETDADREVEPVEESHGGLLLPTGDFMGESGPTSSSWDEPEYIVHEFGSMEANEENEHESEAENRAAAAADDDGGGTHDQEEVEEEVFEELAASESFGESLTCHDATSHL